MPTRHPSTYSMVLAMVGDISAWILAILIAGSLRSESLLNGIPLGWLLLLGLAAAAVQSSVGYFSRLYRGKFHYGVFHEMKSLILATTATGLVVSGLALALGSATGMPRSTGLLAAPLALVLQFGLRYVTRLRVESQIGERTDDQRILVYGAGFLGSSIVRRLQTDAQTTMHPVGFIDDDPSKRGLTIHGVRCWAGSRISRR